MFLAVSNGISSTKIYRRRDCVSMPAFAIFIALLAVKCVRQHHKAEEFLHFHESSS